MPLARIRKLFFLLILLATPVVIYLFLQLFGDNYYEVPVYYEVIPEDTLNCHFPSGPHKVSGFAAQDLTGDSVQVDLSGGLTVLAFLSAVCEDTCLQKFNQLARVQGIFQEEQRVRIVTLVTGELPADGGSFAPSGPAIGASWQFVQLDDDRLKNFITCQLVMSDSPESLHTMVLIDKNGRIRGYYNGLDLEETDRLVLEVRILLYENNLVGNEQNSN